ncbi:MAG: hypothetical protein ACRDJV_00730 [Actinomycetota bacterium]
MSDDNPTANDPSEERLFEELGALVRRTDAVPPQVLAAARGSYTWRTIDAELAELTYDSLLDDDALAGVRSGAQPRQLTFESGELTIELEVGFAARGKRIVGQLIPTQAAAIEIRHPAGEEAVQADELGRFAAEIMTAGPVSFSCRLQTNGEKTITTDWIII